MIIFFVLIGFYECGFYLIRVDLERYSGFVENLVE